MVRAMSPLILALLLFPIMSAAQPWHVNVLWEREGLDDSSNYGHQIVALGDQNDDGFDDWAVFAVSGSYCPMSYVECFRGGNPPTQQPYRVFFPDSNIECIRGISAIGDVNGDGYIDYWLFVYPVGVGIKYLVFHGGPEDDGIADSVLGTPLLLGYLMPIGDFNGDGLDDILMYHLSGGTTIFYSSIAPDTIPDWHISRNLISRHSGDLDNDQIDDIVSSTSGSRAEIYLGADNPDTAVDYINETEPASYLTFGLVGHFDNNIGQDIGNGATLQGEVFSGGSTFDFVSDAVLNFPCSRRPLVYYLGDVNADGYDDIGLMEHCYGGHGTFRLYLGNYDPSAESVLTLNAGGNPLGSMHIQDVCGVGDVNGDGVGDFGIGGHSDLEYIGFRGRAVILSGDSSYHVSSGDPHPAVPSSLSLSVYPNPFNSRTTVTLQLPPGVAPLTLEIFNILGQVVRRIDKPDVGGTVRFSLDAGNTEDGALPSGTYVLRAQWLNFHANQKIMILK